MIKRTPWSLMFIVSLASTFNALEYIDASDFLFCVILGLVVNALEDRSAS